MKDPNPLDYETPRERPRRDYAGCLIPLGLGMIALGAFFWRTPLTQKERDDEFFRLVSFIGIGLGLIGWRLILKMSLWPDTPPPPRQTNDDPSESD